MIGRLETRGAKCRSCRAPVAWGKTQNGKMIPLDPDPTRSGNVHVTGSEQGPRGSVLKLQVYGTSIQGRAEREALRHGGHSLYVAHFTTCPHAAQHRNAA